MGAGLEQSSVYHLQGVRVDPRVLSARADLLDTTSPSSLIYAALDGWRRQMVQHGRELLDTALQLAKSARERLSSIPGLHVISPNDVLGLNKADDQDPLKIVLDLKRLGISGYTANEWLREHRQVDVGLSDHRRIAAQITVADDESTVDRLIDALTDLVHHSDELPRAQHIDLPAPGELELEQAMLPRDAFFGEAEHVDAQKTVGRICAETISPYPPGVPAALPGEVITQAVVDYLRSGIDAGMYIPDSTDSTLDTIRVVAS